jgi:hypothetical protein
MQTAADLGLLAAELPCLGLKEPNNMVCHTGDIAICLPVRPLTMHDLLPTLSAYAG